MVNKSIHRLFTYLLTILLLERGTGNTYDLTLIKLILDKFRKKNIYNMPNEHAMVILLLANIAMITYKGVMVVKIL